MNGPIYITDLLIFTPLSYTERKRIASFPFAKFNWKTEKVSLTTSEIDNLTKTILSRLPLPMADFIMMIALFDDTNFPGVVTEDHYHIAVNKKYADTNIREGLKKLASLLELINKEPHDGSAHN